MFVAKSPFVIANKTPKKTNVCASYRDVICQSRYQWVNGRLVQRSDVDVLKAVNLINDKIISMRYEMNHVSMNNKGEADHINKELQEIYSTILKLECKNMASIEEYKKQTMEQFCDECPEAEECRLYEV